MSSPFKGAYRIFRHKVVRDILRIRAASILFRATALATTYIALEIPNRLLTIAALKTTLKPWSKSMKIVFKGLTAFRPHVKQVMKRK